MKDAIEGGLMGLGASFLGFVLAKLILAVW